jgi:hypothetical protein
MSTLTSTLPHSSMIPSSRPRKARLSKDVRTSVSAVGTTATSHPAGRLETVSPDGQEQFYQDHIMAIFMGLYIETAMGLLLATLGIYLYSHWMI